MVFGQYGYYNGFPYPDSSILWNEMPIVYQNELIMGYILPDGFIDTNLVEVRELADSGPVITFGGYLIRIFFEADSEGEYRPKILGME